MKKKKKITKKQVSTLPLSLILDFAETCIDGVQSAYGTRELAEEVETFVASAKLYFALFESLKQEEKERFQP